jgi:hypothetical protein
MARLAAGAAVLVCVLGSLVWVGAARTPMSLRGLWPVRASSRLDAVQARQAGLLRNNRGLPSDEDLAKQYAAINTQYFDGKLPTIPVRWEPELRRVGPMVAERFRLEGLTDGRLILVNPEVMDDPQGLRRTLCHEMVHVAMFDKGVGHGPEFQQMLRSLADRGAFAGIVATDEEKDAKREALRTELEQLESESRAIPDVRVHLEYDVGGLERAIEDYNRRVAEANARGGDWPPAEEGRDLQRRRVENQRQLADFNARVARYNEAIGRYNKSVDEYNLMISYPDGLDRERLSRRAGLPDDHER